MEQFLDDNNLTIDIMNEREVKKNAKSLKNNLSQKDKNNKQELNKESKKTKIQPKMFLNKNLPSITKPQETENNENINISHNYLNSENNINELQNSINSTKIIDETPKKVIEPNKKNFSYKLIFIYKNEDYYITLKPNCKICDMKEIISKQINLDKDKIILFYKDKEIEEINRNVPVNKYINFTKLKSRPIIYVKKKIY